MPAIVFSRQNEMLINWEQFTTKYILDNNNFFRFPLHAMYNVMKRMADKKVNAYFCSRSMRTSKLALNVNVSHTRMCIIIFQPNKCFQELTTQPNEYRDATTFSMEFFN